MAKMQGVHAAVLKKEIEAQLAARVPAALSPPVQSPVRLLSTGNQPVDSLLGGGLPRGSLCEMTSAACGGSTSLAVSLLATASRNGACAYIDVSDTFSPHHAAAAGVLLHNLLWVRFASPSRIGPIAIQAPHSGNPYTQEPLQHQGRGGLHPRGETKGLAPALEETFFSKEERRRRKMEGTPGYPNQQLGLTEASADQVQWEQFNSRKADSRDPLRQLDQASAEAARQRAGKDMMRPSEHCRDERSAQKPWSLLDRALRATDQVLQAGCFQVIVLDLASVPAEKALRIPAASWWRFQKAAKHSDAVFVPLTPVRCTQSSAACVLECSLGQQPAVAGVLSSTHHVLHVSRRRTGSGLEKKAPGRVASWQAAPFWMRAVGR